MIEKLNNSVFTHADTKQLAVAGLWEICRSGDVSALHSNNSGNKVLQLVCFVQLSYVLENSLSSLQALMLGSKLLGWALFESGELCGVVLTEAMFTVYALIYKGYS